MALSQQISKDLTTALKKRDQAAASCLRLVLNALKGKQKDLGRELQSEEEIAVLKTLVKQRREAAEQFTRGGRVELADKELAELALVETYLPRQLGEQEINSVLDEVFAQVNPAGPQDLGQVMKAIMPRLAGRADGKLVNNLVRQRLSS
jgi:uncharacterized protein YqeY